MVVTLNGITGRHVQSRAEKASKQDRGFAPIRNQRTAASRVDTWGLGRRLYSAMTSTVPVSILLSDSCGSV